METYIHYLSLMRLNKPIGILLLLWPTLWALWLASGGWPNDKILFVFVAGTILMRSAGCVVNDIADRHVDGFVQRTKHRPLVVGTVSTKAASILAAMLCLLAFALVLLCNALTIRLAVIGGALMILYPLLKRITHLPQVGLGVAFSWGVPMAFAAVRGEIGLAGSVVFLTALIWPIIYDTMYAMVDREDDRQIGIKSSAILFGRMDRIIIGLLQILFLLMLVIVGMMFRLASFYYVCVGLVGGLCVYQQWLIKDRERQRCFAAFLNNNWIGLILFMGISLQ